MSVQEERREIIREYIPKLMESLTGFSRDDENFQRCEEFTLNTLRNYRSISVSSHDVKRKLEGMYEKFFVENYQNEANHLMKLSETIINHPLCKDHYETDIQWIILDFLLSISYNPVGALRRRNRSKIPIKMKENDKDSQAVSEYEELLNELKQDFIPVQKQNDDSNNDSDLSDWSDSSDHCTKGKEKNGKLNFNRSSSRQIFNGKSIVPFTINGNPISQPRKYNNHTLVNITNSDAHQFLENCVQNLWWIPELQNKFETSASNYDDDINDANFCLIWHEYLLNLHKTLTPLNMISTISEYQLIHEIIWIFFVPDNYKVFELDKNGIKLRDNVSIPSITVDGFRNAMGFFIPYLNMMNDLKNFIGNVNNGKQQSRLPKTYEFYSTGLSSLLESFYQKLFEIESIIKSQTEIYTVIRLIAEMNQYLKYLQRIHYIHESCILDYTKTPAHICSAYLLTSLLTIFQNSSCKEMANLSISLFLSSIKVFCCIIDTWWTDGRLDDWQNEFVVERSLKTNEICSRLYTKCKEKSFFVASEISKTIRKNDFFKLLMNYSLEAGYTLNLLFQINQIGNLGSKSNFKDDLYNSFVNDVLLNVQHFQQPQQQENNENKIIEISNSTSISSTSSDINEKIENDENFLSNIEDDLLRMVFECNIKNNETRLKMNKNKNDERTTIEIYKKLNSINDSILPLDEILCKSFSNILQARISFANKFVINIYHNEYEILKNLQNIRKVLLLESSDLMHTFYTKLFNQIESGKNWMNPFVLTVQLGDIMSSRFPEVSSLYRIEFTRDKHQSNKVIEAVDDILITCNFRKELRNIISDEHILKYNKVLRFLLKVKWSMWTLENLQFSKLHKKRIPYAEFTINDFLMRSLEQIRFWIMYSIQSIHFHLMTHILQLQTTIDEKIANCHNLAEMKNVHESYINTVCKYCFITDSGHEIRNWIEQFFHLVCVMKLEWNTCLKCISSENLNESDDISDNDKGDHNYASLCSIDNIESSYIKLHQQLARVLNNEVYMKQQSWLSGLSAAFNTSVPY